MWSYLEIQAERSTSINPLYNRYAKKYRYKIKIGKPLFYPCYACISHYRCREAQEAHLSVI